MKKTIAILLSLVMALTLIQPVFAASDALTIRFKIGSSQLLVNHKTKTIEKPYLSGKTVMVPMQPILEAYGAEINDKDKSKINLVYREMTVNFKAGSSMFTANDIKKTFSVAPKAFKNILMVPLDFITTCFGGKASLDKKTGYYSLVLEDDGAISDFSKVIGSISKAKVGNSYFGWTLAIPKGSQITSDSFNSKDISIGNTQRGIVMDVSVDVDDGRKLEDYINEMKDGSKSLNFEETISGKVLDSSINTAASPAYGEVLTTDYDRGSVIRRFYISGGYVYKVTCSSDKEVNPKKLKQDAYFMGFVNSFALGYKGGSPDVKDLSKVKDGMAKYVDSMYGFTFNVPAAWKVIYSNDYSEMRAIKIGLNNTEYIRIYPDLRENSGDIAAYGDSIKALYDANFNSKYYRFGEKTTGSIGGLDACKLVYSLENHGKKSVYDETLIQSDELLYSIKIKMPEAKYEKNKALIDKILGSIQYAPKDLTVIKKAIESMQTESTSNRVGKDDKVTEYTDKDNQWKMSIPGYWVNVPYFDDAYKMFTNEKNQAYIGVETVENTPDTEKLDDRTVFGTLNSIRDGKDGFQFVSKETLNTKGTTVSVYKYRLDDEKSDTYGDVIHYVIHGPKYSYCYFELLQDVYTSEANVKEMQDIWNSFSLTGGT